jgi:hypothetical protein
VILRSVDTATTLPMCASSPFFITAAYSVIFTYDEIQKTAKLHCLDCQFLKVLVSEASRRTIKTPKEHVDSIAIRIQRSVELSIVYTNRIAKKKIRNADSSEDFP